MGQLDLAPKRPIYPPLELFRRLLLASGTSFDPGLEKALADRPSFRFFCGFGRDESTPEEVLLCHFRARWPCAVWQRRYSPN